MGGHTRARGSLGLAARTGDEAIDRQIGVLAAAALDSAAQPTLGELQATAAAKVQAIQRGNSRRRAMAARG